MHPKVYKEFEKILSQHQIQGKVLEIGAKPNKDALLTSRVLKNCQKIGINIDETGTFEDFEVVECNANDMSIFQDGEFAIVLCNAVLESDKFFWKSLQEMRRVLKTNGLLIIGVPSYKNMWFQRLSRFARGKNPISDFLSLSTFTMGMHYCPSDYYRFSEEAFRDVFFAEFDEVIIKTIMAPPRTIGYSLKRSE